MAFMSLLPRSIMGPEPLQKFCCGSNAVHANSVRICVPFKEDEYVTMSSFQRSYSSTSEQNTPTNAENTLVLDPVLNQPSSSRENIIMVHDEPRKDYENPFNIAISAAGGQSKSKPISYPNKISFKTLLNTFHKLSGKVKFPCFPHCDYCMTLVTLCNTKKIQRQNELILVKLGVLNTNMTFIFFYQVRFFQHFAF